MSRKPSPPQPPPPVNRMITPEHVRVRVMQRNPLAETPVGDAVNTCVFFQGDEFTTTPERAAALGDCVQIIP